MEEIKSEVEVKIQARLSKQAKKKLRYEAKREKRRIQKRKNDLKKKQKRAEFLCTLTEDERKSLLADEKSKRSLISEAQTKAIVEGIPLVIDLSYSNFMNIMEITSLITQLTQIVGFLKKCSSQHFRVICANVSDEMRETLKSRGSNKWKIDLVSEDIETIAENKEIVMLSPDGELVLEEISKACVYVVGGLVDKTRKKSLSLKRALDKNIQAYRLPIEEENIVNKKPILNINTVVEIMQRRAEGKEWRTCFIESIPKRMLKEDQNAKEVQNIEGPIENKE